MAAGIAEFDSGYLFGAQPWHRDKRYIVSDVPLTLHQVREVFNWEMEKRQLCFIDKDNQYQNVNQFAIVRKDTGHIIAESVGSKFEAESTLKLVDIIEEGVLKACPDLLIEGAITLFNNKISVIQLKAKEFQVKGDKSPSFSRMCFSNPIALGAYRVLVHNERVVCANTLRVAEAEGKANRSLKKFSHLKGAFPKINFYMEELAEQWLMIEKHIEVLNNLAKVQVTSDNVTNFLKHVYPQSTSMSDVAINHNLEKRQAIVDQFNKDQDLDVTSAFTKYGLLQAFTYVIDHEQLRKHSSKTVWENIAGSRMDLKAAAFDYLKQVA